MEASHFGITPSAYADAMIAAFNTLIIVDGGPGAGGTGCVKTVGRVVDKKSESLVAALAGGVPAILLFYNGGTYDTQDTTGFHYDDLLRFDVFCVAGSLLNTRARQADADDERDSSVVLVPGVEQLQDWAAYLGMRALRDASASNPKLVDHSQAFLVAPETLVGIVSFTAERTIDLDDDTVANSLQKLGLCHDTTGGPGDLFEVDNTTPKSEWPRTVDGGVAELDD